MATPHISAERGQIAGTVLMPGDPLRAAFIARTFLEDPVEFSHVRGMLGFTGVYGGRPVSVMGSGMGMPSVGIYSWELFTVFGVDRIIRVGSAGAYAEDLRLYDVILATEAYSESSYARVMSGFEGAVIPASPGLCEVLRRGAAARGASLREGRIHSSDVFYVEENGRTPSWRVFRDERGCVAVEMESFALFHNARAAGKSAACLLTVANHMETGEETTAGERERGFTRMVEIALSAV